jgi:hypothetical protein
MGEKAKKVEARGAGGLARWLSGLPTPRVGAGQRKVNLLLPLAQGGPPCAPADEAVRTP